MVNYKQKYLGNLNITILGAYSPVESKKRLENLRDCLRDSGFLKAHLVEDALVPIAVTRSLKDQDKIFLVKSQYEMQNSDALIFVFGKNDISDGHKTELNYFYDFLYDKLIDKTLFLVEKGGMKKLSSLVRAQINNNKDSPGTYCFKTLKELCSYSYGQLFAIFIKN